MWCCQGRGGHRLPPQAPFFPISISHVSRVHYYEFIPKYKALVEIYCTNFSINTLYQCSSFTRTEINCRQHNYCFIFNLATCFDLWPEVETCCQIKDITLTSCADVNLFPSLLYLTQRDDKSTSTLNFQSKYFLSLPLTHYCIINQYVTEYVRYYFNLVRTAYPVGE